MIMAETVAFTMVPLKSNSMARREAIVVHSRGLSVFDLLRYWQHDRAAVLCAFRQRKDLLALTL
jgi:hypothetical protein